MAAKWARKNWDILVVVAVTIGVTIVFGLLIFRPLPLPPGY
jgi:hypothetical protein